MSISFKPMNTKESSNFKPADTFTGYLLRGGETGFCCCTEIMDDPVFLEQLDHLYEQQKSDFYKEFTPSKLAFWKNRDFKIEKRIEAEKMAADPKYKPKDLRRAEAQRNTILRKDKIFQTKPYYIRRTKKNGQTVNRDQAQKVNNIIHKISATQLAAQTSGKTGYKFLEILPIHATKEQVIHILSQIRKAIPAGFPALITIHKDLKENNLHLQGWISSKEWEAGAWKQYHNSAEEMIDKVRINPRTGEPVIDTRTKKEIVDKIRTNRSYFDSEAGLDTFRLAVAQAVAETGLKFKHAGDKSLPATATRHQYTRTLLRTRSTEDFISGKVKEGVKSQIVRDECDQIGARAKAIQDKEKKNADIILALNRNQAIMDIAEVNMAAVAGHVRIPAGPVVAAEPDEQFTITEAELAAAISATKKESANGIIRNATL